MTDRKYNELLKAYIKENKAVPGGYVIYNELPLGNWYVEKVLSNPIEIGKELAKLKMPVMLSWVDERWMYKYKLVKQYYVKNKLFPTTSVSYKGEQIGTWLRTQISKYKEGKLLKYRRRNLVELGVLDDVLPYKNKHDCEEVYSLIEEYIQKYEVIPNKSSMYKCRYVGNWVCAHQMMKNTKLLNKKELEALDIFNKTVIDTLTGVWERHLNYLKVYVEREKRVPEVGEYIAKDGKDIGLWLVNQKKLYETEGNSRSQLEERVTEVLNGIGIGTGIGVSEEEEEEEEEVLKTSKTIESLSNLEVKEEKTEKLAEGSKATEKEEEGIELVTKDNYSSVLESLLDDYEQDKDTNDTKVKVEENEAKKESKENKNNYSTIKNDMDMDIELLKEVYTESKTNSDILTSLSEMGLTKQLEEVYIWYKNYNTTLEFMYLYKQLPIKGITYKGLDIGSWVDEQREYILKDMQKNNTVRATKKTSSQVDTSLTSTNNIDKPTRLDNVRRKNLIDLVTEKIRLD